MPAMSPVLAICIISFCESLGKLPSSTSLFSLGVAVPDFVGGWEGAAWPASAPSVCAIV